jgi:hypothetical protein
MVMTSQPKEKCVILLIKHNKCHTCAMNSRDCSKQEELQYHKHSAVVQTVKGSVIHCKGSGMLAPCVEAVSAVQEELW